MTRDGLSFDEFAELLSARRAQYISGDFSEMQMRLFLGRNGYSATDIQSEINDLRPQWLAALRAKDHKEI